jgi:tellurite resistance protein
MPNADKITLLARIARSHAETPLATGTAPPSILTLAAASYGARPSDESTVPTGFDPAACALFECLVEAAYLTASADGVFDADERHTFEHVVVESCGGAVAPNLVSGLISDLGDQLKEDGLDKRIEAIGRQVTRVEHAHEILRIAALLAQTSDDVSDVERALLLKLAHACKLQDADVDRSLDEVKSALASAK